MSGFRNNLTLVALLAALVPAAAQDGSGVPRDPSQDGNVRRPPERRPSTAVPLPPEGTIGNPTPPSASPDPVPEAVPSNTQPGDFAQPSDGATDPQIPSLFSPTAENAPSSLPLGEVAPTPSRADILVRDQYTIDPPKVETAPLDEIDPSTAGTLPEKEGGLGGEMWAGTDRATAAALIEAMPVATPSPAMNALVRRVLLTGAAAGEGKGPSLFALRAARLLDAGRVDDLVKLLGASKADAGPVRIAALLLADRVTDACAAQRKGADDGAALQLRSFCQLVAGDAAAAALSADLARVKGVRDGAFDALSAHLTDGAPLDAAALKDLTPLTLAMARHAKAKLGATALENAAPAILSVLASGETLPPNLRATAAERAAALGAIDTPQLIAAFRAADAKATSGAEAGARHLQTVIAIDDPARRATAIAEAWRFAEGRGLTAIYADLLGRAAWEIPPSAGTAREADTLTRILLLAGRADRAADWLNVAETLPPGLADELTVRVGIAMPARVRLTAAGKALERLTTAGATDPALVARLRLYEAALAAMGAALPPSAQTLPAAAAESADISALDEAACAGRKGETILRALVLIGPSGPASAEPARVFAAVAALNRVGLTAEAGALATEAILTRPISGGG